MEILLIRHGQSKGNETSTVQGQTDEGLSKLGKKQATELSDCFKAGDLNAIYSSDLKRATETARPTARKLNIKIKIDPNFREASFGIWEGLTYEGVKEKYKVEYSAWYKNYYVRPGWFESFDSHFKRIKKAIKNILQIHKSNERIAIFTHGGSIKTQLAYFQKLKGEELSRLTIKNGSLTSVEFNPTTQYEKGKLIYYNKEVIKNG
ncbi:MAG: histidine phosphatase family protein [Candidatus Melainabacteria bacterium]|nr:histidine phosphatase family protein [Candidatus Melainabacteria bacterium]